MVPGWCVLRMCSPQRSHVFNETSKSRSKIQTILLVISPKWIYCVIQRPLRDESLLETPGGSQLVTNVAVTSLSHLVNHVNINQQYCWSKHFSRTLISFLFSFIVLSIYNYMKAISLPDSLCGLCER